MIWLLFRQLLPLPKQMFRKNKSSSKAKIPNQLLIQLANQNENPVTVLPEYDSSKQCLHWKISDYQCKIKCFTWPKLSNELQQWMIDLTERNMEDLYNSSSWKWNRQSKLNEFKHKTARHLIVFKEDPTDLPIAFVHFRFEEGYCSDATVYCYELQIEAEYRRLGIGRYLMNILQTLATKYRMRKVILTTLKENTGAFEFYTKALKFTIDKNSPSCFDQVADYEILSKRTEKDL